MRAAPHDDPGHPAAPVRPAPSTAQARGPALDTPDEPPRPQPPARRSGFAWAPLALTAFALLLFAAASRRDWGDGAQGVPLRGVLVTLVGVLPCVAWWLLRRSDVTRVGRIPFLPLVGLLYALYFGAPVLMRDGFGIDKLKITAEGLRTALDLALIGWLMALLGWGVAGRWTRRLRPLRLELDVRRALRWAPVLLAVGMGAMLARRLVPLPEGLAQPVRFVETLFQVGLGIVVIGAFRGWIPTRTRALLWFGLVPAWLFLHVGQGAVAQVAYAALFLLFLAWGAGRRVPIVHLAVLALILIVLRGHVHTFRSQTWHEESPHAGAGLVERSALFFELLVAEFRADGPQALYDAVDQVYERIAHLGELAHVVELTPREIPYWEGETFATLPTTLVPRILWPGKPEKRIGQEFGHRYHLLAPDDHSTAINLPQLIEFYANFGTRGVVLGMLLFGMLYRLLDRWWNTPGTGDGTLLLAAILFSRLVLIESDFSLVYGAVIQQALLLILVLRAMRPREQEAASAATQPA